MIDGSLTTKSTCISHFRDVFGRNNLAPSSRQLFRESADTDAWTDTQIHARACTRTHTCSQASSLRAFVVLLHFDLSGSM